MYTLDCSYYHKEFSSIQELVEAVIQDGMDPNYEILKNGKPTGEILWDYVVL